MIKSRLVYAALATMLVAGCSDLPFDNDDAVTRVSFGTGFNMCVGYCYTQMTVAGTQVTLLERSFDDPAYPPRVSTFTITAAEWQRIASLADPAALEQVAGIHGCPDCADGGLEYVELRVDGRLLRSTYDYRRTLEPIAGLQAELRALHDRLRMD